MNEAPFEAIVIGASAGGIRALTQVLSAFPEALPLPVLIVQHLQASAESYLARILNSRSGMHVKEADEKELILPGYAYTAPPGYHLMVDDDRTCSLSLEGAVNFARPSVDVLFESAVTVYRNHLIGVILTGANHDGATGLRTLKQAGGYTIVQLPSDAEVPAMPEAAIAACKKVDKVLPLKDIGPYILQLLHHRDKM